MKGSHLFWLSRSKGITVDIWIRDYNPPRCFHIILQGVSRRKSLAGVMQLQCRLVVDGKDLSHSCQLHRCPNMDYAEHAFGNSINQQENFVPLIDKLVYRSYDLHT
jgi:hypothetical protein